jgi:hypothetical protein
VAVKETVGREFAVTSRSEQRTPRPPARQTTGTPELVRVIVIVKSKAREAARA